MADYINENFEPAWVSLRPVPRVTIDFGNDRVVQRTLHGNIATWICAADGTTIDILPGIYQLEPYRQALAKVETVHRDYLAICKTSPEQFLSNYHADEIEAANTKFTNTRHPMNAKKTAKTIALTPTASPISKLAEDTMLNETVRRAAIHRHLKEQGLVKPEDVTKWLYREVLHADLDDPYLGLGESLFGNYPFAEEDAEVSKELSVNVSKELSVNVSKEVDTEDAR